VSELNLEQLLSELSDEQDIAVDWNAPEAGQFPPIAKPGSYEFVFRLREDEPFGSVEILGTKYLTVVFDGDVLINGESKTLTYQRVNVFKHEKVAMSSAAELARSLNLRPANNPPTNRDWVETFQAASGRARGRAELAWRYFDKPTGVTYSTSPRKRKNQSGVKVKDTAWPRNADGTFADTVTASDGTKHYGQAEFIRFFTPAVSADAANG
jgi:hypothetical protein